MEIYLDANATTPVLAQAREAAIAAMGDAFGNPSSVHSSGLRARALLDDVRATARRLLGANTGQMVFTSGATEGIQTAVLSALIELRCRRDGGDPTQWLLIYGATEHKAVPMALAHWNALLGLDLPIRVLPVGANGRHDLAWLRKHAPSAGLVCTMVANNETGVISDLDGVREALAGSPALWMVDGVQGLGKLPLRLTERGVDYAPFSGHKIYAPKGMGLLYVREGAPFTPLQAGGGQEGALRSGTENMPGIAAFGAVLRALETSDAFADQTTMAVYRERLAAALREAFPGVVFNAPLELCLPTTLNFSVPGVGSKLLLDLFDAAGLRVSGGSACSAAKAQPSFVLEAMGLPEWQTASAIRLSFGAAERGEVIDEACSRIRSCGVALWANCLGSVQQSNAAPPDLVTRFVVDGACCYLIADASSRRCIVIDPLPELTERLVQWIGCRGYTVAAVVATRGHGDPASTVRALRQALPVLLVDPIEPEPLGWPSGSAHVQMGRLRLTRLALPGHTADSTAYLLSDGADLVFAFVGDTVLPGALGRSDLYQSEPLAYASSLRLLEHAVGPATLLLPMHDHHGSFATTLAIERAAQPLLAGVLHGRLDAGAFAVAKAELDLFTSAARDSAMPHGAQDSDAELAKEELSLAKAQALLRGHPSPLVVDVREAYEQRLGELLLDQFRVEVKHAPLSSLVSALPHLLNQPSDRPVLFYCRSGNRSGQAARALRRLGHMQAWSLEGGMARWTEPSPAETNGLVASAA